MKSANRGTRGVRVIIAGDYSAAKRIFLRGVRDTYVDYDSDKYEHKLSSDAWPIPYEDVGVHLQVWLCQPLVKGIKKYINQKVQGQVLIVAIDCSLQPGEEDFNLAEMCKDQKIDEMLKSAKSAGFNSKEGNEKDVSFCLHFENPPTETQLKQLQNQLNKWLKDNKFEDMFGSCVINAACAKEGQSVHNIFMDIAKKTPAASQGQEQKENEQKEEEDRREREKFFRRDLKSILENYTKGVDGFGVLSMFRKHVDAVSKIVIELEDGCSWQEAIKSLQEYVNNPGDNKINPESAFNTTVVKEINSAAKKYEIVAQSKNIMSEDIGALSGKVGIHPNTQ